jgi:endosialidase-like protein
MPSSNPSQAHSRKRSWGNSEDERAAGRKFLEAILQDDSLRGKVVGSREEARTQFIDKGDIDVPPDVEVVCVQPTKDARKKVVVFVLPEKGEVLQSDLATLKYWVAAWTPYSSARFKRGIKHMGTASNSLLSLRPVTFRYKRELDPADVPQFGLVAEDVEKANPALVIRDSTGKPYGVRYDAVNAMLLNEFLKQHRTVLRQGRVIAQQKRELDALDKRVDGLSARGRPKRSRDRQRISA